MSTNVITSPHHESPLPLYAALVGTFFLRMGGGVMGVLIGLFLNAKDNEMRVPETGNPSYIISATLVGLIAASFFITELGGSFIAGGLIDRNGPKRYMIFGPLFGAVAVFMTALLHLQGSSPFPQFVLFLSLLFATRLLEGAAGATTTPATLAYVAVYTAGDAKLRSRISGYFEIATLIGAAGGFVVGGVMWDKLHQTAFLADAAVYGLAALVMFVGVRNIVGAATTEQAESHNLKDYWKLMTSPRLRELIPAWLAISALLGVLFNHATFQLSIGQNRAIRTAFSTQTLSHTFSGREIGAVFGLYGAAFGLGIVLWSTVVPRMRKSTVMLISACGVIAASILIAAINHTGPINEPSTIRLVLLPLMFIAVMVESGFTPAALVYLSDLSELHAEKRGMVMGLYSFLLGFGQLLGSIIAGPFADRQGVDGLLLFMGILGVICIFSVTLLRRDELITHQATGPVATSITPETAAK